MHATKTCELAGIVSPWCKTEGRPMLCSIPHATQQYKYVAPLASLRRHRRLSGRGMADDYDTAAGAADADVDGSAAPRYRTAHHAELMLHRIERCAAAGQLTDVVLVAGGRRVPAHRVVLAAASDYFAAMFGGEMREAGEAEVAMKNVDGEALEALVSYAYTGEVELREDSVEALLATAGLLQLPEVVEACCRFLMRRLQPTNCLGIRQFADTQACEDLYRVANNYVMENFTEVIHQQEFLDICAADVAKVLASDDVNVRSEEEVFHALVLWVRHDLAARTPHMADLLGRVKLPLLSPQFLADEVERCSLVRDDPACQRLLFDALRYHLLPERRHALAGPRTHPRKATVGAVLAVGGIDSSKGATSIERYELRTNTWTQTASVSGRRLQFGAAFIDGRLYVVGGRDGLKTLNTFECYDCERKAWALMPPMATHRHGLGVAVLQGPLYAVGGHDGWSYMNTVERWDAQARQWSFVAPMSSARSTAGVAVLNNKLYAVGGRDGGSCLRSVESFDPHTNKWGLCSSMSRRRGGVGVATCNGYLYAVGGHDSPASNPTASRFDCVERYDCKTDTWTLVAPLSSPRDAVGVCVLGDRLFVAGGYDGQAYLNDVEIYDPQTNEWTKVSPLCMGRAGAILLHCPAQPS